MLPGQVRSAPASVAVDPIDLERHGASPVTI
jgi:hypothetical protein